jgi:hypothetical protein
MSNTQVAIDAIRQLAIADEEIQKLRTENEALKSNLAALESRIKNGVRVSVVASSGQGETTVKTGRGCADATLILDEEE